MTHFALLRTASASVRRFAADQRGTTAIEYGLMVALIGIAVLATVFSMGQGIKNTLYGQISNSLANMTQ
jgi:pilus assembly protein Flp/PilA